ncbi:MAG: hypothetical protein KGN36_11830 [Acidobacteriota bacterium]|nr:hypothetical protein [Acidobacteriota bacterium]
MTPTVHEWLVEPDPSGTLEALSRILHAAVHDGASVGFVLPFPVDEARTI